MRKTPHARRCTWRHLAWPATGAALALLLLVLALQPYAPPADNKPPSPTHEVAGAAAPASPAGPPWHHGPADARVTVILYADLECPFCKAYHPKLVAWIDRHPDIRVQWHHLPLLMHEPAASQLASLAECAGETGGNPAYWEAVDWIYRNTRGGGQGLPEGVRYPGQTDAVQACLDSGRTLPVVQAQARESARDGITATPTLRVRDERSGQSLLLHGPVEGDALLSALDLLEAGQSPTTSPDPEGMPAADVGIPR